MEKAFNDSKMLNNGFQDPMGYDAHQGLERWLNKFHQPTMPSHTIITDPEYFVFLWFHNAVGNIIKCPYINDSYVTKLQSSSVNFDEVNAQFWGTGIQGGTNDVNLPKTCIDLTPFVREASLPDIAPANAEQIETLFGNTTAGAFSPYASDGQKPITLQMVDTEYSILDAIFYPWMKDINSPWWYRPNDVYTKWATPYPMATLEVQRPRMRYRKNEQALESRNDSDYTYYSYKFIGVKPTSYAAFELNGAGRQNLLRQLSLISDMCIVDLTGDVAGSSAESTNLGNRTKFIFQGEPSSTPDENDDPDQDDEDPNDELNDLDDELDDVDDDIDDNEDDIDQQDDDDMPGEDEDEWMDEDDPDYDPDEYPDDYDEDDDPDDEDSDEDPDEDEDEPEDEEGDDEPDEEEDTRTPWQKFKDKLADMMKNPNGDKNDDENDKDKPEEEEKPEEEKSFFDKIKDGLSSAADKIKDAASDAVGWIKDKVDDAKDAAQSLGDKAVAAAKKLGSSVLGFFGIGNNDDDGGSDNSGSSDTPQTSSSDNASGPAADLQAEAKAEEQASNSVMSRIMKERKKFQEKKERLKEKARLRSTMVYGYAASPVQRDIVEMGINETTPFSLIEDALVEKFTTEVVAFGVVMDVPCGDVTLPFGNTVMYGGIMSSGMVPAMPFAADMVGKAAASINGAVLGLTGVERTSDSQTQGVLDQIASASEDVNRCRIMCDTLNIAFMDILDKMEDVGFLLERVAGSGINVGEFGNLVRRITTGKGNIPTPVETFAGIITKLDTKGSSAM